MAVKIVSKIQAPIDYLRKFLPREIEVVKGLRHPNLIRFLQAIETTHRSAVKHRLESIAAIWFGPMVCDGTCTRPRLNPTRRARHAR